MGKFRNSRLTLLPYYLALHYDPTTTLVNKFQRELAKLRKDGKFDNRTYNVYPSDAISEQFYGVIEAHKPEKKLSNENQSQLLEHLNI